MKGTLRFAACAALACCLASHAWGASVSGMLLNPGDCVNVEILCRERARDPLKPETRQVQYDPTSGAFRVDDLPAGWYDLRCTYDAGGTCEGVNLKLNSADPEAKPLAPEDEAAIRDVIARLPPEFMDITRPLILRGDSARALVLVEQIRHRSFHAAEKDDIIWRTEVWEFANQTGAWVRVKPARGTTVLARIRSPQDMPATAFARLVRTYAPDFGGILLAKDTCVEGLRLELLKPDSTRGKTPGSVESQVEAKKREGGAQ